MRKVNLDSKTEIGNVTILIQSQIHKYLKQMSTENKQPKQLINQPSQPSLSQTLIEKIKLKQKQVTQLFQYCKYEEADNVLSSCIQQIEQNLQQCTDQENKNQLLIKMIDLLLNRGSLYMAINKYEKGLLDLEKCSKVIEQGQKIEYGNTPRLYSMKITCLLKLKKNSEAQKLAQDSLKQYPYHKKLQDLAKLSKEKVIAGDEETYMELMFEKLCQHPTVKDYLKEEAFLTKVERIIRNPSLTSALEKLDPRIREASEALMMSDENWS